MSAVLTIRSLRSLVLAIAVIGGVVSLTLVIQQVMRGDPIIPPQRRGLQAQEAVMADWAAAMTARDYATAERLMADDPLTRAHIRSRNEEQVTRGWARRFTITTLEQTGTAATGVIHWTGDYPRDLCIPVQVSDDGRLTVLADFRWCRDGE